jgi:hypothetical protein
MSTPFIKNIFITNCLTSVYELIFSLAMKPFTLFCNLPGHEIAEGFDTWEEAFKAHYHHIDRVMETSLDFERIDKGMGILDATGSIPQAIMAPEVNKRAVSTGLMDRFLIEQEQANPVECFFTESAEEIEALALKAEQMNIMANESPEVVRDHMYSGV